MESQKHEIQGSQIVDIYDPHVSDAQRFGDRRGRAKFDAAWVMFRDHEDKDFPTGIPWYSAPGVRSIVCDPDNLRLVRPHINELKLSFLGNGVHWNQCTELFIRWTAPRDLPFNCFAGAHRCTTAYALMEDPETEHHPEVEIMRREGIPAGKFKIHSARIPITTKNFLKSLSNSLAITLRENAVEWYIQLYPLLSQFSSYAKSHKLPSDKPSIYHPKMCVWYSAAVTSDVKLYFTKQRKNVSVAAKDSKDAKDDSDKYNWELLNQLTSVSRALHNWQLVEDIRRYYGDNTHSEYKATAGDQATIFYTLKLVVDKCGGNSEIDVGFEDEKVTVKVRQCFLSSLMLQLMKRCLKHAEDDVCPFLFQAGATGIAEQVKAILSCPLKGSVSSAQERAAFGELDEKEKESDAKDEKDNKADQPGDKPAKTSAKEVALAKRNAIVRDIRRWSRKDVNDLRVVDDLRHQLFFLAKTLGDDFLDKLATDDPEFKFFKALRCAMDSIANVAPPYPL